MTHFPSVNQAGPAPARPPRQRLEDKVKAALRREVWETSQFFETAAIREYVDAVCREIEADDH